MAQELGYGILLAFMLMEIHKDEDTKNKKHDGKSSQCNLNFYRGAKEFGIDPKFVHVDKDLRKYLLQRYAFPNDQANWKKLRRMDYSWYH